MHRLIQPHMHIYIRVNSSLNDSVFVAVHIVCVCDCVPETHMI